MTGENVTFTAETIQHKTNNLFYEPIPFEMLKSFEEKPQVIVNIDNQPAVCNHRNCDFSYVEPNGTVTLFTYDMATKKVVVTGVDLPPLENITQVEFALDYCAIDNTTLTNTTLECTLVSEPTCGNYAPKIITTWGIVPVN